MLTEIGSIFPKGCGLAGVGIGSTRPSPFEDIGFAKLDHHRPLRAGLPWVVLASGKLPEQLAKIILRMAESGVNVLATCADPRAFTAAQQRLEHFHRYCNADIALSHPSCARVGHPDLTLSVTSCGAILPRVSYHAVDIDHRFCATYVATMICLVLWLVKNCL